MSGSVTVRLSAPLERRLKSRAAKEGRTPSDLVRSLIEREVNGSVDLSFTFYERSKHILETLIGDPSLPPGASAREALEDWNPDRRD
jgi:predicted DNA-binding protein